jgi:hypothetical protein
MGVACQTPASVTGAFVFELQADGQEEGQYPFEKRLSIAKQVIVGRFIVEIDGDGAVLPRFCRVCMAALPNLSPPDHQVS